MVDEMLPPRALAVQARDIGAECEGALHMRLSLAEFTFILNPPAISRIHHLCEVFMRERDVSPEDIAARERVR